MKKKEVKMAEGTVLEKEDSNSNLHKGASHKLDSYAYHVYGAGLAPGSGAVPDSTEALVTKTPTDIVKMLHQVTQTQVDLLCQKGDTNGAMDIIKKFLEEEEKRMRGYGNPLNIFKKDSQNGGSPYMGGHCFYGAFRDKAGDMFDIFYKKKSDQGMKASDRHLRKSVRIIPNHVFFYRNGKIIEKPDEIEGQQPTQDVPGFARYEVIHLPWEIEFTVQITVDGPFREFLANRENVLKAIVGSAMNGIGSRRSAGYGWWEVHKIVLQEWNVMSGVSLR